MRRMDSAAVCLDGCHGAESRGGYIDYLLRVITRHQLSTLYGDSVSCVSSTTGFHEISSVHALCNFAGDLCFSFRTFFIPNPSLGFHLICDLESLALQRAELRTCLNVHAARRTQTRRV